MTVAEVQGKESGTVSVCGQNEARRGGEAATEGKDREKERDAPARGHLLHEEALCAELHGRVTLLDGPRALRELSLVLRCDVHGRDRLDGRRGGLGGRRGGKLEGRGGHYLDG